MPRLDSPSRPVSPWQLLYGGAHRLRRAWYRQRARRLPRPVVSVGNLHFGGTGKTPLTAALAAHLRDAGIAVCILSRGYGSHGEGVRVVSTGEGPLLGPAAGGDEPVLLAGELPGVAVVVGADRFAAGRHALEHLAPRPDLFLLDDGFSHLALARDLDLLAFPAADPFAGGRLAPGGRLREPLAAAERAHAVLLTGAREDERGDPETGRGGAGEALAAALAPHGFAGFGFASVTAAAPPVLVDGPPRPPGTRPLPPATRVLVVAGIARPQRFAALAREAAVEVAGERFYPDHHPYPEESLEEIRRAAADSGAEAVLATAKDRVKLLGRLELALAELPVRAEPEPAFWRWFDAQVTALLDGDATLVRRSGQRSGRPSGPASGDQAGAPARRDTGC